MKLSFVIPAHNEEAYIEKCLDSIIQESKNSPYEIEIILVNNASTDSTRAIAEKYGKQIKIVDEPRKGLVWARHAGHLASQGDHIANIDADMILPPGWIKKVYSEFEKDDKLVTLSGPFIYHDLAKSARALSEVFYYITYATYILNRFILRIGSVVQGGNFVVKRSALEKIGGFDTNISFYGEDTDIARRMSKVGKVKFTFRLRIYSSGRRLAKEGVLTAGLRYSINYFWILIFKHPFSKSYEDFRPTKEGATLAYTPKSKLREWAIATVVFVLFVGVLGGIGYGVYYIAESSTISTINFVSMRAEADRLSSSTKNMLKEKWNEIGQ